MAGTRHAALIVSSFAGVAALILLLSRKPRAVQLTEQQVEVEAEPDQVFQVLTAFDEGPKIVARSAYEIIAEFPVRTGWLRLSTLERITLDPSLRQVTFEQLRSPFFTVRTATEIFALSQKRGGGTTITLNGALWPRLGLFGLLVTQHVVRPRWDKIDAAFLARVRERAQAGNT